MEMSCLPRARTKAEIHPAAPEMEGATYADDERPSRGVQEHEAESSNFPRAHRRVRCSDRSWPPGVRPCARRRPGQAPEIQDGRKAEVQAFRKRKWDEIEKDEVAKFRVQRFMLGEDHFETRQHRTHEEPAE